MPAPRGNKNALGNKGGGRRTTQRRVAVCGEWLAIVHEEGAPYPEAVELNRISASQVSGE